MSKDAWDLAKADAEVERILALSDEEVLAEIRKEGGDPEIIAAESRLMFDRILGRRPH